MTTADDRVRIFIFDKVAWCKTFEHVHLVTPPKLHFTVLEPLALKSSCRTPAISFETARTRVEKRIPARN